MGRIVIRLLAGLREAVGKQYIEVEADDWKEALARAAEREPALQVAIREDGEPKPGYLVFVDGVDSRLAERGPAREVVVLPVNHGGSSEVKLLRITWNDIVDAVGEVARAIEASGFKPDMIVGILRGGVVPARLLADELGVDDIGVIEIKLYTSIGARKPQPYLRQPLILPATNRRVLVVDDVSDTGLTLQHALEAIKLYNPSEVRTATLYVKPWTKLMPDYYARIVDEWVVFPWEYREVEREVGSKPEVESGEA